MKIKMRTLQWVGEKTVIGYLVYRSCSLTFSLYAFISCTR